jgi:hypothetical protein
MFAEQIRFECPDAVELPQLVETSINDARSRYQWIYSDGEIVGVFTYYSLISEDKHTSKYFTYVRRGIVADLCAATSSDPDSVISHCRAYDTAYMDEDELYICVASILSKHLYVQSNNLTVPLSNSEFDRNVLLTFVHKLVSAAELVSPTADIITDTVRSFVDTMNEYHTVVDLPICYNKPQSVCLLFLNIITMFAITRDIGYDIDVNFRIIKNIEKNNIDWYINRQ